MLKPELAKERLETFRVKDGKGRQLNRVAELPENLRGTAFGLLGYSPEGKALKTNDAQQAHQQAWNEAMQSLAAMEPKARTQIFTALLPEIAGAVEQTWRLFDRLPYQNGYLRKSFRIKDVPELPHARRSAWLYSLLEKLRSYEQDLIWLAEWAAYLGYNVDEYGYLFAASIESGSKEGAQVFEILCDSARGTHPVGAMGRHVSRALLVACRPDGWEFMEKMLLAAQRQEGLRQVILEGVDEAHPEAYRRMLRLILDHDLIRFSAVTRAVDVWFGLRWDVTNTRATKEAIAFVLSLLDEQSQPETQQSKGSFLTRMVRIALLWSESGNVEIPPAITEEQDAQKLHFRLWTLAMTDAHRALQAAQSLLKDASVERRWVAANLLLNLHLPEAEAALLNVLEDEDLRIVTVALTALQHAINRHHPNSIQDLPSDTFERIERLISRLPERSKTLEPILWPWTGQTISTELAANMLHRCLGDRSPRCLVPYLRIMGGWACSQVLQEIGKISPVEWSEELRATVFTLVGDNDYYVRLNIQNALANCELRPDEAQQMEKLLTRKTAETRLVALNLLLKQPDDGALASADRLLAKSNENQRFAGLELLQQMTRQNRASEASQKRAREFPAKRSKVTEKEQRLIDSLLDQKRVEATLDDALGLLNHADRTPPIVPKIIEGVMPETEGAAEAILKSLDDLIHQHRETPIRVQLWDGSTPEQLLGNVQWGFPNPNVQTPLEEDLARLPLRDVWEDWWTNRTDDLRDPDGRELLRVLTLCEKWQHSSNFAYATIVRPLVFWLLRLFTPPDAPECLLDNLENTLATIPPDLMEYEPKPNVNYYDGGWRGQPHRLRWLYVARTHIAYYPETWTTEHHRRLWGLLRWTDEPGTSLPRYRPDWMFLLPAFEAGVATEADVIDALLGPGLALNSRHRNFNELGQLTARKPSAECVQTPRLRELALLCRDRVIEVELQRGDLPTAATVAALSLRSSGGMKVVLALLKALGTEPLPRGNAYYYGNAAGRAKTFAHLLRVSLPEPTDTPEAFAAQVQEAKLSQARLIELAVYAPQWAKFVEYALGWNGLEEAIWWLHAHTKDTSWSVDAEIRELWTAQAAERTPLDAQSLLDGGVDVAWFHRTYSALGAEHWTALDEAAKYASSGTGHKRAQLFADAMLGRVTKPELISRIKEKRNQDALRSLGLLPLAKDSARDRDVLERYKIIQEFVRGSKEFGAMRQASEKLAASIAMENLARTAGFPDPGRLEWAMEAEAIADLAAGPLIETVGDVTVTLALNAWGAPALTTEKSGKLLKNIPPAVKKDSAVAALVDRKKEVERQASRMRKSLEQAMCRGDQFTGSELRSLMAHPVLAPMLRSLVFVALTPGPSPNTSSLRSVGEGRQTQGGTSSLLPVPTGASGSGTTEAFVSPLPSEVRASLGEGTGVRASSFGYPINSGTALESHDGTVQPLDTEATIRLAHPHDLLRSNEWHLWQRDCFLRERIQPFKQVFRELYVLTPNEADEDGTDSHRYAGHQVNPRQGLALLGGRGWVNKPEEGLRRTFHDLGIVAGITFNEYFSTPAEVEGLTVESVFFTRRGEWKPMQQEEIPPRLFSEVMRDVDLMVSVAHIGGVDPEASASTMEMRQNLIRETCGLLKLTNVRFEGSHVLIDGELATYSVHLGSAVVHRQPGGFLCIVPVHAQHRGRLFLPFADDDPRTAEALSKVLLLAKDTQIKDPTILEQILPRK